MFWYASNHPIADNVRTSFFIYLNTTHNKVKTSDYKLGFLKIKSLTIHTDTCHYFIRELVENRNVIIDQVATEN